MISTQLLQNTLDGVKGISKLELAVLDAEGRLVYTTAHASGKKAQDFSFVLPFIDSDETFRKDKAHCLFKVFSDEELTYILVVFGAASSAQQVGELTAFQLRGLLGAFRERLDKDNFIKNLLLDNLLLVDIYNQAKKLKIENNLRRLVYLIESTSDSDTNANVLDVVRGIFPQRSKDYITAVDESSIILIKEIDEKADRRELERTAMTIADTLSSEAMSRVRVAIGSAVTDLKDISRSFKEAKIALEVGKIFYEEKNVINYNRLGIGRLIYQVPLSLCRKFIEEIFRDVDLEELDEENLSTISKFFENSLNISETSRQLYIHRNTLVYRLDKLQKNTGLDIRNFEDAITFKIALMVSRYMHYMENSGFGA